MKNNFISLFSIVILSHCHIVTFSQNVGLGITSPVAKLHIKGSDNISQLIIEANGTQSNTSPLIRLRSSFGTDRLWIHSDTAFNTFIGLHAGRVNNAVGGGLDQYLSR